MTQSNKTIDGIPATAGLVLNSRAEFRDLLIRAGLARGAAEKLSRGGRSGPARHRGSPLKTLLERIGE